MSIASGEFWFQVYMLLFVSAGMTIFVILIMHFLMPRIVVEKYFKPSYFSPAECMMFSGFPFGIIRTIIFLRVIGFPKSSRKRGLTEVHTLVPECYRSISKFIVLSIIVIFLSIVLISIGFYMHSLIN